MNEMRNARVVCLWILAVTTIPALCFAQRLHVLDEGIGHFEAPGGPLSRTAVLDAPFSADATTTVHMTTLEGRLQLERSATSRYYRDRAGRVRVEQMLATDGSQPSPRDPIWITIEDPAGHSELGLDPRTRVARIMPWLHTDAVGGGHTFGIPLGLGPKGDQRFLVFFRPSHYREALTGTVQEEPLGDREIDGVATVGQRTTITLSGAAVQLIDERWESPDLKLLIYSRLADPRSGVLEYRVANIKRDEPPPELFVRPANYEFNTRVTPVTYEPWGNPPWR